MKEKKARVEDALHATRAAVEEGIVPGGGVALAARDRRSKASKLEGDEQIGVDIIRSALEEPIRMIARTRAVRARSWSRRCAAPKDKNFGYNARLRHATRTWSRPASSTRPR